MILLALQKVLIKILLQQLRHKQTCEIEYLDFLMGILKKNDKASHNFTEKVKANISKLLRGFCEHGQSQQELPRWLASKVKDAIAKFKAVEHVHYSTMEFISARDFTIFMTKVYTECVQAQFAFFFLAEETLTIMCSAAECQEIIIQGTAQALFMAILPEMI